MDIFKGKTHVIWDWNGTLIQDVDICFELLNETRTELDMVPISLREYRENMCFPIADFYRKIGIVADQQTFSAMSLKFIKSYAQKIKAVGPCSTMFQAISSLTNNGKSHSILTAGHEDDLKKALSNYQLSHHFDHVVGLNNYNAGKKTAIGHELMEKLMHQGLQKENMLYVGDTDHDGEVAASLGVSCVLVDDGHQCPTRFDSKYQVVSRGQFANLALG